MNHILRFPDSKKQFVISDELLNKFQALYPNRTFDTVPIAPNAPSHPAGVSTSSSVVPLGGVGVFDQYRQREQHLTDVDKLNVGLLANLMIKRLRTNVPR